MSLLAVGVAAWLVGAAMDVRPPQLVPFGTSPTDARTLLEPHCRELSVRELDAAELPIAEHRHVQIDCQGLDHAGQARFSEWVFADGALVLVWVLVDAAELPELREALVATLGPPSHETEAFVAFMSSHSALRRDKPELLYFSPEVAAFFAAWFDQSVASAPEP
ncbi:MAG: hypothetical protein AAGA23_22985 [Pseudomonadota bacterium]